jgi:hypothetical protein
MMHTYRVSDLALASNVPIPELIPATVFDLGCRFELLPAGNPSPGNFAWFHQWTFQQETEKEGGEEPWVQFARSGDGYLLRFPSYGDFFLSAEATEIQCRPLPGIPEVTVRHLLLDQVVPLVLSRRERIVLHVSAVLTAHGVIAFAGKSGDGKSTLAASFAQRGCALLSDDCLVLRAERGSWTALPSYPGVRLWPSAAENLLPEHAGSKDVAHYTIKRRVSNTDVLPFSTSPAPLRSLFFLSGDTSAVSIEKLSATRTFVALVEFAYNLDITDAAFLRRQFETIGQLTAQVPAYAIHYPREFSSLPVVRETILNYLEQDQHHDAE